MTGVFSSAACRELKEAKGRTRAAANVTDLKILVNLPAAVFTFLSLFVLNLNSLDENKSPNAERINAEREYRIWGWL